MTAIVRTLFFNAVLCAVMSVPIARPLMTAVSGLVPGREETILSHHSLPYGEMSRVPMTAMFVHSVKISRNGLSLLTYRPIGWSSHSFSRAGKKASSLQMNLMPAASSLFSSMYDFSYSRSDRRQMSFVYGSISLSFVDPILNTSDADPMLSTRV